MDLILRLIMLNVEFNLSRNSERKGVESSKVLQESRLEKICRSDKELKGAGRVPEPPDLPSGSAIVNTLTMVTNLIKTVFLII